MNYSWPHPLWNYSVAPAHIPEELNFCVVRLPSLSVQRELIQMSPGNLIELVAVFISMEGGAASLGLGLALTEPYPYGTAMLRACTIFTTIGKILQSCLHVQG